MGLTVRAVFVLIVIAVTVAAQGDDSAAAAEELIAVADQVPAIDNRATQFVGVQLKPNPRKRSDYRVLESNGLHSHFRSRLSSADDEAAYLLDSTIASSEGTESGAALKRDANPSSAASDLDPDFTIFNVVRPRRDLNERVDTRVLVEGEQDNDESVKDGQTGEQLPTPAAQQMEAGGDYRRARSRLTDDPMDVGLKRSPRVNFVTQARSLQTDLPSEHRDLKAAASTANNPDSIYRRPYDGPYYPPYRKEYHRKEYGRGRFFDGYYPMPGTDQRYDPYMNRGDYYNNNNMVNNNRYDPYYGNQNRPMMAAMNPGYYQQERRPDWVENRNYGYMPPPPPPPPPPYMNDVNYMPAPSSGGGGNRRVIYYATLPEIVRNPPFDRPGAGGDGRYGNYKSYPTPEDYDYYQRYPADDYNNYRYFRDMRNNYGHHYPQQQQQPPLHASRPGYNSNNGLNPIRGGSDDRQGSDKHSNGHGDSDKKDGGGGGKQTVSSNIRIQEGNNNSNSNSNNKGYNRNGYNEAATAQNQSPSDARINDFTQPHYRLE